MKTSSAKEFGLEPDDEGIERNGLILSEKKGKKSKTELNET